MAALYSSDSDHTEDDDDGAGDASYSSSDPTTDDDDGGAAPFSSFDGAADDDGGGEGRDDGGSSSRSIPDSSLRSIPDQKRPLEDGGEDLFSTTNEQAVLYFLLEKALGRPTPPNKIVHGVDIFAADPPLSCISSYFFLPAVDNGRRTPGGYWTARVGSEKAIGIVPCGYWTARVGSEKAIVKDQLVGLKKYLSFYQGEPPKGVETKWRMVEYRLNPATFSPDLEEILAIDNSVVCKMYEKLKWKLKTSDRKVQLGDGRSVRLPVGFLFTPTHEQVVEFLLRKARGLSLPPNPIKEANVYEADPSDLILRRKSRGSYFLSDTRRPPRTRRVQTPNGYWETEYRTDESITVDNRPMGSKKSLIFFEGQPPNGVKTRWRMLEYRLNTYSDEGDMKEGNMKDYADYAIFKIWRVGGEGRDMVD